MADNYKQLTHTAEEIDKAVDLANVNATEVYALKNYAMQVIQTELNNIEKNKADAETVEELKKDIEKLDKDAENKYTKSEVDEKLNDKVKKIEGKGLSTNDFSDEYKNKINKNAEDLENTYSKSEVDKKIGDKVDKIEGKGLSTNDFDNKYKSKVDNTYSKSEVDNKMKDKVDKVIGKMLSTNDFTDDYQKRIHDTYTKAVTNASAIEQLKSIKADKSALDETNAAVAANKENLQGQIDNLVLNAGGDSNAEVVQARVGLDGTSYETLKSRLDSEREAEQENWSVFKKYISADKEIITHEFTTEGSKGFETSYKLLKGVKYEIRAIESQNEELSAYIKDNIDDVVRVNRKASATFVPQHTGCLVVYDPGATVGSAVKIAIRSMMFDASAENVTTPARYADYTIDGYINNLGEISSETGKRTDYIPIKFGTKISGYARGLNGNIGIYGFFDADKKPISIFYGTNDYEDFDITVRQA